MRVEGVLLRLGEERRLLVDFGDSGAFFMRRRRRPRGRRSARPKRRSLISIPPPDGALSAATAWTLCCRTTAPRGPSRTRRSSRHLRTDSERRRRRLTRMCRSNRATRRRAVRSSSTRLVGEVALALARPPRHAVRSRSRRRTTGAHRRTAPRSWTAISDDLSREPVSVICSPSTISTLPESRTDASTQSNNDTTWRLVCSARTRS